MASTSTAPPNSVLDEIEALFAWNPPLLFASDKKSSTKTRPPGFYDKHFSPKLILKRVERLPSLVQDLADNVDNALQVALPTLPPLGPAFTTAERRKHERRNLPRKAKNELAVASFYEQTTPKYCLSVASTLALHPAASFSEWSSLLLWTPSVSSSGYAIMDGELRFSDDVGVEDEVKLHRAAILDTMEGDIRRIFERMRDDESSLGTWEFKSLDAGTEDVMSAVLNLGRFAWTTCTATNCNKLLCHRKAVEKVTKVVVGSDAQDPPWSLRSTAEVGPSTLPPSANAGPSTLRLSPAFEPLFSLSPLTSDDEWTPSTETKGQKRDDMSPPRKHAKERQRDSDDDEEAEEAEKEYDDEEEYHDEEEEEAYQDRHDLTAQSLVQQAWAQATRVDGTVIVLHSGNHELVGVRHRASQTLYVSEVIEPHACVEPGYGKLHVGIYVAAIQDAMNRKQQQQPPPVSHGSHGGSLIGGSKGQDDNRNSGGGRRDGPGHRRGKPKGGSGTGSGGLQRSAGGSGTDGGLAIERTIQEGGGSDVALVYLQYDVYDSPVPALFLRFAPPMTFTRCPTPPISPRSIRSYKPEECLTIFLTSEIGRGATGVVHRGTLTSEIPDGALLDIVVKLAFDTEQRKALRNEYQVYRHLKLRGVRRGIATALGFFDDSEDGACALVLLYAGVPLSTESRGNLSIPDCKTALSTLESIHCAGILHGDIRLENFLISDSGITIIDFGHSRRSDNKRAKEEMARLRHILGLAGESL